MISLAFWATVINYLDRQALSVAAPVLREQFHMSNEVYSRVVFAFISPTQSQTESPAPSLTVWERVSVTRSASDGGPSPPSCTPSRIGPLTLGVSRLLLGIGRSR